MCTIEPSAHRSKIDIVLTLAGTTGIVALVLPFHSNWLGPHIPIKALLNRYAWMLAVPALLAVPICLAWAIRIMDRRFSQPVQALQYALGAGASAVTLLSFVAVLTDSESHGTQRCAVPMGLCGRVEYRRLLCHGRVHGLHGAIVHGVAQALSSAKRRCAPRICVMKCFP